MSEKFNVTAVGDGVVRAHFQAARRASRRRCRRQRRSDARRRRSATSVFEHVWFAYNQGSKASAEPPSKLSPPPTKPAADSAPNWVLKDISFDVRPGERVGIVGATGSGKTTLINLLLRFYDVTRGRITIDGVDIRKLDLADVRGLFSLVLQDVHLFSGTIADNIRLGSPRSTTSGCVKAARAVHADAVHHATARRLRQRRRRARLDSVGRPEAAAVVRARAGVRSARADARRGDVERRHRDRAPHSRCAAACSWPAGRRSRSRTGCRRFRTWTKFSSCTRASCASSGTHQELLAQRGIYFKLFELQYRQEQKLEVRS